jgi:predicted signal transduction protein with EAL and GGDEF domain
MTSGTASEYETVLGKANMALKFARKEKKFHQLFDASVQENLKFGQNLEWSNKIREAIASSRIITYYQPIMDLRDGIITKYGRTVGKEKLEKNTFIQKKLLLEC